MMVVEHPSLARRSRSRSSGVGERPDVRRGERAVVTPARGRARERTRAVGSGRLCWRSRPDGRRCWPAARLRRRAGDAPPALSTRAAGPMPRRLVAGWRARDSSSRPARRRRTAPGEIAVLRRARPTRTTAHRAPLERARRPRPPRVQDDRRVRRRLDARRAGRVARAAGGAAARPRSRSWCARPSRRSTRRVARPADIGAPALWDQGSPATGVRIAVLDTGLDVTHPDLDDLRLPALVGAAPRPAKVVDAARLQRRRGCGRSSASDGHGHGTHVAGIAAGTGEGTPLASDDGRYAGIAPDAELAVGKVLTDAGAGINSDLLAPWSGRRCRPKRCSACSVGARHREHEPRVGVAAGPSQHRLGRRPRQPDAEPAGRPLRDAVRRRGGNSGPYIGSVLEAPGSAAQALSVGGVGQGLGRQPRRHALGRHVRRLPALSGGRPTTCSAGGRRPSRRRSASFSSRGPSGDLWLRPDVVRPATTSSPPRRPPAPPLAQNDLNRGTRSDPLYATATGTSMATPATAGSAALLLQGYRGAARRRCPSGSSGRPGLPAPAYALRSRGADEHRRARTCTRRAGSSRPTSTRTRSARRQPDPLLVEFCGIVAPIVGTLGNQRAVRGSQRRRRSVRRAARRGCRQAERRAGARCAARRRRRLQRGLRVGR